jgi:hypothetical protein
VGNQRDTKEDLHGKYTDTSEEKGGPELDGQWKSSAVGKPAMGAGLGLGIALDGDTTEEDDRIADFMDKAAPTGDNNT